jgi:hypothetical protein
MWPMSGVMLTGLAHDGLHGWCLTALTLMDLYGARSVTACTSAAGNILGSFDSQVLLPKRRAVRMALVLR